MSKITYTDKVTLNENPNVADVNKVRADDLNEIKNVVNANDDKFNYTQEEQRIGTWIDGKPLYKKVIQGTTADGDISIDLSYLHIDTLVNIGGTAGSNGDFKPINFDYSGYSISTRYSLGIMYVNASTPYANMPFNIVIEYTKTTD